MVRIAGRRFDFKRVLVRKTQTRKNMSTRDSNGTELNDGDTVMVIKDLKVKGMSKTLKRGSQVKNIRLVANEEQVECRIGKSTLVLKAAFMKKV
jgi:protein PhnA